MAKFKPLTAEEKKEKSDQYTKNVADLFIEGIETSTVPWMMPWKKNEYYSDFNPVTKTVYSGINELYLPLVRHCLLNSPDPRWLTFNQCREKGYNVKKGSKGSIVKYFERIPVDKEGVVIPADKRNIIEAKSYIPHAKQWIVFNASQINVARKDENGNPLLDKEGKQFYDPLPPYEVPGIEPTDEFMPIKKAEELIKKSGAIIKHDANSSYYTAAFDEIHLLAKNQYLSQEGYYGTALHELGHWTGHNTRLDRPLMNRFGTNDYAREELNAEIASFIMCKKLNLDFTPQNNIAYVKSWVKNLKDTPSEIFDACKMATKISEYCFSFKNTKTKNQTTSKKDTLEVTLKVKKGRGV